MRPCRSCGGPIPNHVRKCPDCGEQQEQRVAKPASHPKDLDRKADSVERRMLIGFIAALFLIPLVILVPLFGVEGLIVAVAIPFLAVGYFVAGGLR